MSYPIARLQLRWLPPEEGGRQSGPPLGPVFTPTARFAQDSIDSQFSVLLHRSGTDSNTWEWKDVELFLLFPENLPEIVSHLAPGSNLKIHEGRIVVAERQVLTVHMMEGKQPTGLRQFASSRPPATSANT